MFGLGGADCEALREGLLAQPANSVSSLAYAAAGVYVVQRGGSLIAALALAAVSVGSVLYHGPMPTGAGLAHDGSIAVLAFTMFVLIWRRHLGRPPLTAVVVGAAGLVLYLLSRTGAPLCQPDSVLQGHAAWHVLTAAACATWLGSAVARLPEQAVSDEHYRAGDTRGDERSDRSDQRR